MKHLKLATVITILLIPVAVLGQQPASFAGKYEGTAIRELPGDYLNWLLENVELKHALFRTLSEEFERRGVAA